MSKLLLLTHYPIIYQDDALVVIDKPEGVLSHPNPSSARFTKDGIRKRAPSAFEGGYDFSARRFDTPAGPLWLIHRLDQDASGLLLAARSRDAALKCRTFFEKREVRKIYLALVAGRPHPERGRWRDHLRERKKSAYVRSYVNPRGLPNAELRYVVAKNYPKSKLSILEIELITGKTHQIRVQAAFHGHPIAGDRIYGDFPLNKNLRRHLGLRRLSLHAAGLEMKHPLTGKQLRFQAPLPVELEKCFEQAS